MERDFANIDSRELHPDSRVLPRELWKFPTDLAFCRDT